MVMTSVALPEPVPFVVVMVAFVAPATDGVPEITPVVVFTLKPVGRPVALNDVGVLLPVIW